MVSSIDSDPFDTLSLAETDASSDFELIDVEHDDVRSVALSSIGSDAASTTSEAETQPPSPQLHASRFHFPDPVSSFEGPELDLESSSLYTLLSPSQQSDQPVASELNQQVDEHDESAEEDLQQVAGAAINYDDLEKMEVLLPIAEKHAGPLQPRRRIATIAPKAAWIVAVLAAVLLGFKSSSLLGLSQRAPSQLIGHAFDFKPKFASPSHMSHIASTDNLVNRASVSVPVSLALAPSPSPSSLTIANPELVKELVRGTADARTKDRAGYRQRRRPVALQETFTKSKSLSVVHDVPAQPSKANSFVRPSLRPKISGKRRRYSALAGQLPFKMPSDLPVFPPKSRSSYLDNATTTSWDFWLAELDNYYRLAVRPVILAAKEQAYEAARFAHQYHHEQLVSTFATLRKQAISTAQRSIKFASQYKEERIRPAYAYFREHTAQTAQRTARYHEDVLIPALAQLHSQAAEAARTTSDELNRAAKRTAEYHDKVVVPALAQFRVQAVEAAQTTSEGLNKAAQKFSIEAAGTVKQVKEATNIDLEALGVDAYVGFMITTLQSVKHNLRNAEKAMLA
ncbi:hypothetical protein PSEUBRA_002339 [Kalmanozyma brasiliensis GHG001]|uniref:Uncharacterized protein n=1 Tax=Kalmanozyma brasiliensis (strain GHG001) TaxID=1365824 RepID=V5EXK5_KALBG|nr:uncharacterized protein PSEUBRA_002339 [Kalmanozyma brasiliensis GHG001]EST08248.1 hypothetical protein PSEUBRA_002339 [Kalmanozyma brasiliensis GHG001]